MKRVFAPLMLMVMVLFVSGCGGDDSIPLTLDNYADYLDISVKYKLGSVSYSNSGKIAEYSSVDTECDITPASDLFVYNDVTVTLMIWGTIVYEDDYQDKREEYDFPEKEITAKCNVGGKWSFDTKYQLDRPIRSGKVIGRYMFEDHNYLDNISLAYEVVSVNGTVSKAG